MDKYPLDYAFGAALLTLLAVSAAVWIGQAWTYHKRLKRIRRNAWNSYGHPAFFMPTRRWPTE